MIAGRFILKARWINIVFPLLCISSTWGNKYPIVLSTSDWGMVEENEIQAVLNSTWMIFIPFSESIKSSEIQVERTVSSPITFYKKSKDGKYRIGLSANNRNWCQYVFQFAHELGHIICGMKKGDQSNQWFEESLCEAASLFALNRISETWEKSPPYPDWKSFAIEFKIYREARIQNSSYPENFHLPSWWEKNRSLLSKNSSLRKENLWVAITLLNLIEKDPGVAWSACRWLNHLKSSQIKSFENYLNDWKNSCQKIEQKEFVHEIMYAFGLSRS